MGYGAGYGHKKAADALRSDGVSPYPVLVSMDNIDKKIRRFLVEEGYLFPQTDEEIELAISQLNESGFKVPPEFAQRILNACLKQKPPKHDVSTAKPQKTK